MKILRKQLGLTQQALANKVGTTQQCIGAIELGQAPSVSMAQGIAKALGCSWTRFFESCSAIDGGEQHGKGTEQTPLASP